MAPVKKDKLPLGSTYISQWRAKSGMSQEELAEKINMSRSALSKIETSDSPYSQRTLEAMAASLGCHPADLLGINPAEDEPIFGLIRKLDDRKRKMAIRIIKGIVEDAQEEALDLRE